MLSAFVLNQYIVQLVWNGLIWYVNEHEDDVYLGVWIAEGAMVTLLCRKDFLHVPSSAPMNGAADVVVAFLLSSHYFSVNHLLLGCGTSRQRAKMERIQLIEITFWGQIFYVESLGFTASD